MDYPFRSDGCSGVSDLNAEMRVCCTVHDWGYYLGGPEAHRKVQDYLFAQHILRCKTWARFFLHRWLGVRLFGWAFIPASKWRWGYGWEYPYYGQGLPIHPTLGPALDLSQYSEESQCRALGRAIYRAAGVTHEDLVNLWGASCFTSRGSF